MKFLYLLPPLSSTQKFWCECGQVDNPKMTAKTILNNNCLGVQHCYCCENGHPVQIKDQTTGEFIETHERFYESFKNIFDLESAEKIINELMVLKTQLLFSDPTIDFVENDVVIGLADNDTNEQMEVSLSQALAMKDIGLLYESKQDFYAMSGEAS